MMSNLNAKKTSAVSYRSLPHSQRGASVSGVVFFIIALGVFVKLGLAIIPAQIGDYQLTKSIALELKKANDNKESSREFMKNLEKRLQLNSDYETSPEEIFVFTNETTGNLAVHKDYEVVSNLFGNVDIVNRFEGEITAADVAN